MIIEDQDMSDCPAIYGDRSTRPRRLSTVRALWHRLACRFEYSLFFLGLSNADILENLRFLRCGALVACSTGNGWPVSLDRHGRIKPEQ
jgi:hypothetical protein